MTEQYIYHFPKDGHVHKGYSRDCSVCKRKAAKKAKRKSNDRPPARTCPCGVKIDRNNKSGLCIKCLNKERKVKKPSVEVQFTCNTEGCTNKVGPKNQSGLCAKCFRKSDHWRQQRENFTSWNTAAVFSTDVKTASREKKVAGDD